MGKGVTKIEKRIPLVYQQINQICYKFYKGTRNKYLDQEKQINQFRKHSQKTHTVPTDDLWLHNLSMRSF